MHLFSPLKPEHNANAVDGWRSRSEKTKTPHPKKKKKKKKPNRIRKMGESETRSHLEKTLEPFYQRASESEVGFFYFHFFFFSFFKTFLDEFQWFFLSLYLKILVISHYFWLYVSWFWALFTFLWYGFYIYIFLILQPLCLCVGLYECRLKHVWVVWN